MEKRRALLKGWLAAAAVFCLGLLLLAPNPGLAATLNVPLDYSGIQSAINTAADGDTILVSNGTYYENINFNGKAITVKSVNGAANTTIDGNQNGSVVTFANSELHSAVLDGFTVTNGTGTINSSYGNGITGGGIYCYFSSPTITNCTIRGNSASSGGGGVDFNYSSSPYSPIITNCTISGNSSGTGGGIHCWLSSPIITNCTISSNSANYGGGIECGGSSSAITNCIISGNSAGTGGGINLDGSPVTFTNCTISGNSDGGGGGGIHLYYCTLPPVVVNSILWGNSSEIWNDSSAIINITYSDVQGGWTGTGNINTDPLFVNAAAGDFHLQAGSPCIDTATSNGTPFTDIAGTSRPQGTGYDMGAYEYCEYCGPSTISALTYPSISCNGSFTISWSSVNGTDNYILQRATNPSFTDATSVYSGSDTTYSETSLTNGLYYYRVRATSSCWIRSWGNGSIIVGSPTPVSISYPAINVGGNFVVNWSSVTGSSGYILQRATNSSFTDATSVYSGSNISYSETGLANDTYYYRVKAANSCGDSGWENGSAITVRPGITHNVSVSGDYTTIQAAINAAVDGDTVLVADGRYVENINFNGKNITVRSVNGAANTIIDGNQNGSVVIFANSELHSAVLDGFTITNGLATDSTYRYGGGIYCSSASPTITNCIISSNFASNWGSGIHCGDGGTPVIANCTISGNTGDTSIFIGDGASGTIANCTISSNSGGGCSLRLRGGSTTLTDCTIRHNEGGARISHAWIPTYASGAFVFTNCVITGNSDGNAGIQAYDSLDAPSSLAVINCTISSNAGNWLVGGITTSITSASVTNCILWGNTDQYGNPSQIYNAGQTLAVTYSDIQSGWSGTGNIDADPLFVNAAAGNFHLQSGSPCINTGIASGAPATDKDGTPRPQGAGFDMGAYEYGTRVDAVLTPLQGDTVCVQVNVAKVSNLYAADFDLLYNPAVLSYNGVTEGNLLNSGGYSTTLHVASLSGSSGHLVVGISRQGNVSGASGSGTLVTLCFNVIGNYGDISDIIFSHAVLECPAQGCTVSAAWNNVSFTVTRPLPPNDVITSDPGRHNEIDICWSAVTGAVYYEVWRSNTANGEYSMIGTTAETCYHDTTVLPNLSYYYYVKAVAANGHISQPSATVSGTMTGLLGDLNNDGRVDGLDQSRLLRGFGTTCSTTGFDSRADLNRDCIIDGDDLSLLAADFGKTL